MRQPMKKAPDKQTETKKEREFKMPQKVWDKMRKTAGPELNEEQQIEAAIKEYQSQFK